MHSIYCMAFAHIISPTGYRGIINATPVIIVGTRSCLIFDGTSLWRCCRVRFQVKTDASTTGASASWFKVTCTGLEHSEHMKVLLYHSNSGDSNMPAAPLSGSAVRF